MPRLTNRRNYKSNPTDRRAAAVTRARHKGDASRRGNYMIKLPASSSSYGHARWPVFTRLSPANPIIPNERRGDDHGSLMFPEGGGGRGGRTCGKRHELFSSADTVFHSCRRRTLRALFSRAPRLRAKRRITRFGHSPGRPRGPSNISNCTHNCT